MRRSQKSRGKCQFGVAGRNVRRSNHCHRPPPHGRYVVPAPHHPMNTNRRQFLKTASFSLGSLGLAASGVLGAEPKDKKAKEKKADAVPLVSFAKKSKMKLGTVTYNLAMDWDIPTIIKNCTEAQFEG